MRRYSIALLSLTLVMTVASLLPMWFAPTSYHAFMPLTVLYFTAVTGLQHYCSLRSARKDPRTFIKIFLALTVGTLFLHLAVLTAYMFSHLHAALAAKHFLITFCICYIVYLFFETTALVLMVRKNNK